MFGTKGFLIGYQYSGDKVAIPLHEVRRIDDCGEKKHKNLYDKKRWEYEVALIHEGKTISLYSDVQGLEKFLEKCVV